MGNSLTLVFSIFQPGFAGQSLAFPDSRFRFVIGVVVVSSDPEVLCSLPEDLLTILSSSPKHTGLPPDAP